MTKSERDQSSGKILGAGVLLAITSSLCCIVPLLTIVGGVSGAASGLAWIGPMRPYIIGATVLILGYSFYQAYKPQLVAEDCCAPQKKKRFIQSKTFLWIVTCLSALFMTFPYYSHLFFEQQVAVNSTASIDNLQTKIFTIEGMSCKECENHVNAAALGQAGVAEVNTNYDQGFTEVKFDPTKNSPSEIAAAIESETGYKVEPK
jgi:mercuric ion transport protein